MNRDTAPDLAKTFAPAAALHDRAAGRPARHPRRTMEQAGSFTAVPGLGRRSDGNLRARGRGDRARQPDEGRWLAVWLVEARSPSRSRRGPLARKAKRGAPPAEGAARKFMLSFFPPVAAGAALTLALYRTGDIAAIPATWLLLYGSGMVTAGTFSVRIGSGHGPLLHAGGGRRAASPAARLETPTWPRLRRAPPPVRRPDRVEARWLTRPTPAASRRGRTDSSGGGRVARGEAADRSARRQDDRPKPQEVDPTTPSTRKRRPRATRPVERPASSTNASASASRARSRSTTAELQRPRGVSSVPRTAT